MITCPFCHKHVHLSRDERDTNSLLSDNDTDDFYCPTYVDVTTGRRWCHYSRCTRQGWWPEYTAIIPPFRVDYTETKGVSVVKINLHEGSDLATFTPIYEDTINPSFDKFVQLYHRFKILRAFS